MLDDLEEVARSVRRCKHPFGGLQLVLTGDFHQLPPVAKGRQATAGALNDSVILVSSFDASFLLHDPSCNALSSSVGAHCGSIVQSFLTVAGLPCRAEVCV